MVDSQLFTKLKKLRETYTFDLDKEMVMVWEKDLREALVREKLSKHATIKKLVKNLQKMIKEITFSLAHDYELSKPDNAQQRRDMFVARKCYKWLVSFFTDSKNQIANIEKIVEEEIKA